MKISNGMNKNYLFPIILMADWAETVALQVGSVGWILRNPADIMSDLPVPRARISHPHNYP